MSIQIQVTDVAHAHYAQQVAKLLEESAKKRGTGIAKRSGFYLLQKIAEGKAVIALDEDILVGFCYIESWEHGKYVAHSGLVVNPEYRKLGIAKQVKQKIFDLSREKYPIAKIFGITTSLATMRINSELGYKPVTFSELTKDEAFWAGCQSCCNYDILQRNNKAMCLCTGLLCEPQIKTEPKNAKPHSSEKLSQEEELVFNF